MQFFDELPVGRSSREQPVDWAAKKAELIANPGQWGLMAENISGSIADQLRNGRNKNFRGDELRHFEFRVRKPENPAAPYGNRRTDIYGRYTERVKRSAKA